MMYEDLGKLVLRLGVAGLMLFHGVAKIMHGTSFIAGMLAERGLPAVMVYGVYIGEVVAPLLLIIGLFTRLAGMTIAINMLVAIYLVHMGDLASWGEHGAWKIELPMFYFFASLAITFLGAGKYSLDNRNKDGF